MAPNILELLQIKFPPGEYILMEEVSDHVNRKNRSLDYMAIGMWSSRGHAIIGVEQKSNRSDWLTELKTPQKQESHFKYCDRFYLLTTNEGVARPEEIPATWGWMNIEKYKNGNGFRLKVMKEAPFLSPIPPSIEFVCAMLRRAADKGEWVRRNSIQSEVERAREDGIRSALGEKDRELEELRGLKEEVEKFEESASVNFSTWNYSAGDLGKAVKLYLEGDLGGVQEDLKRMRDSLLKTAENISSLLDPHQ